jgi:hypothetical protein
LDILPLDARIGKRELDGTGSHFHGGLALEATERVQTHADDATSFLLSLTLWLQIP